MIYVTCSVYTLGKQFGPDGAVQYFHDQLTEAHKRISQVVDAPAPARNAMLPAVRVVARLQTLDSVALRIDAGATVIGKARSRAFHGFRESDADVWVSVDDDIDATQETLRWLVEAVGYPNVAGTPPRICIAPYMLRRGREQTPTLAVELPRFVSERSLPSGGKVRNASAGGFGLVAMNRAAMHEIVEHVQFQLPELRWLDDDEKDKLAVFHDLLAGLKWYGEDLSFFRRVPSSVEVEALCTGHTSHAGDVANLSALML